MNLFISAITKQTPEVLFDLDTLEFRLRGFSRPENADRFYQPIFSWLTDNQRAIFEHDKVLRLTIDLEYINSSSLIFLIKLMKICVDTRDGKRIDINWLYDENDADDIIETCNELWTVIGVPITMICRNESQN